MFRHCKICISLLYMLPFCLNSLEVKYFTRNIDKHWKAMIRKNIARVYFRSNPVYILYEGGAGSSGNSYLDLSNTDQRIFSVILKMLMSSIGNGWYFFRIVYGYCSARWWYKILKRPKLGVKNPMMDIILFIMATKPHKMTAIEDLKPKNVFWVFEEQPPLPKVPLPAYIS